MKQKILFIDDDRYFARLYAENLQADYEVIICYDAETAVKKIHNEPQIAAAVVDIMMPCPTGHEAECRDGNMTGVWIVTQCQAVIRDRRIALLLFTNRAPNYVKEEIQMLALDPRITEVAGKISLPAIEIAPKVGALISRR